MKQSLKPNQNIHFGYATANGLILLQSNGPDGLQEEYKLNDLIAQAKNVDEANSLVSPFTYDPTNGTVSGGDLFLVKAVPSVKK